MKKIIGKTDNLEVDFVVRDKNGFTKYIQVSYTVKDKAALDRELTPFDKIPDYNERLLITRCGFYENFTNIKKNCIFV